MVVELSRRFCAPSDLVLHTKTVHLIYSSDATQEDGAVRHHAMGVVSELSNKLGAQTLVVSPPVMTH
jgi:hypothetical protein